MNLFFKTICIYSFILTTHFGFSQEVPEIPNVEEWGEIDTSKKVEYEEVSPEFPGGVDSMLTFIKRECVYPEKAKKKKIQGIVYVQFVVDKDGSIVDVKVVKGVSKSLDEEAGLTILAWT